jgi:hypothetical protein
VLRKHGHGQISISGPYLETYVAPRKYVIGDDLTLGYSIRKLGIELDAVTTYKNNMDSK